MNSVQPEKKDDRINISQKLFSFREYKKKLKKQYDYFAV